MFYKTFYRDLAIVGVLLTFLTLTAWGIYRIIYRGFVLSNIESIDNRSEEKIGALIVEQMINKQEGFYEMKNSKIDSAINVIKARLISNIDSTSYNHNFYVVNNSEVNAFTLPGGNIIIYSGLLELADSAEEVAAVLAHELGHAEEKHIINRLVTSYGIEIVLSLIMGTDPSIINEITEKLVSTKFDRDQEEAADLFGLKLLEKSGIDPKQIANFFRKMNNKGLDYDKRFELIMTHPDNDSRIKKSETYITADSFIEQKIEIDWYIVVKELKQKY